MGRIITIANQKGGVGKTTTAVSLGGLLAQQGRRVLLVDLDPQGSMSCYFGLNPEAAEHSVYSLFQAQGELVNAGLARLYDGLRAPALKRYGETDDREDELL